MILWVAATAVPLFLHPCDRVLTSLWEGGRPWPFVRIHARMRLFLLQCGVCLCCWRDLPPLILPLLLLLLSICYLLVGLCVLVRVRVRVFILRQLAGRQDGFELGSTIRPQTKGLWMWSSTLDVEREIYNPVSGEMEVSTCKILLIDTEGIASFTQNDTHDVKVFSLALLLSSFFVYNSLGSIDESAIERLS